MPDLTRAKDMTKTERQFMRIAPWLVTGKCSKCGKPVTVRVYGLRAEFNDVKLICKDCKR
jgi:hypothetical protein